MGRPPRHLPDSKSSPRPLPQADDALSALRTILSPLVRLLLATGVDYTRLAAELKPLFIEQARQELLRSGGKDTDSALSLLSGVHRKDVRKWRESGLADSISKEVSLSTQVYARWAHDSQYLDRRRRPKPLPRLGTAPSFDSLALSVTKDVRPYTILAELLRLGLVEVEDRKGQEYVVPNRDGFIPPAGSRELIELFGHNLADHADAAVANLLDSQPRLEQSVFADGITAESAARLSELARKLWNQMRAEMIAEASRLYEHDRGRSDASHRMRFGSYYWDEPGMPAADPPSAGSKASEDD
ncbi:MAG: hypothetical protein HGA75_06845 [Thiobacillus sp.]|nr:hypothetical protein [Thiobacillus sp.]